MRVRRAVILLVFALMPSLTSCVDVNQEIRDLFSSQAADDREVLRPTSTQDAPSAAPAQQSDRKQPPVSADPSQPVQDLVLPGTGAFINKDVALRGRAGSLRGPGVTLNFANAEIPEVVQSVLGNILELNYVIDPRVTGTVTLQTSQPIAISDVLPTLETVLRLQGFTITHTGDIYAVAPTDAGLRGNVVPGSGPDGAQRGDAYGVQIIPLEHTSASEMAGIIEPLASKGAIVRIDDARNLLVVAGTRIERDSIFEIVNIFDVDWFSGMSFALTPLKFSGPEAVIADLDKIFDKPGSKGDTKLIRFQPIERMNAILTVSSRPAGLVLAKTWINRLDIGSPTNDRRLYVYRVQNGRAADLAAVLTSIFGGTESRSSIESTGDLAPGLKPVTITSRADELTTAQSDDTAAAAAVQQGLAQRALQKVPQDSKLVPSAPEQRPVVARQQTTSATEALADGTALSPEANIRIIADEINNSLVVMATPSEYRQVEDALERLDIVPLQVLIEATIAEVRLSDQLKYGVQWFFDSGSTDVTLSSVATGAVSSGFPGFSVLFANSDVRVVLNALDSVTDVNVISTPQLLVLDNRTAELQVGDQVPVATQSAVSLVTPDAPVVNSIEFRDTGIVLRVTPRVNDSGLITLDIEQEVSDVIETTTSGIDSPTIQQRRLKTSVAVQSNNTIALGGLIRNRRSNKTDGVPVLSRIPILGLLFGSTDDKVDRTELLILIRPRIIRNQEDARKITDELKLRVRSLTIETP